MAALRDDSLTTTFDPSRTAPSTALVEAIAEAENVDPSRLFTHEDLDIHDFVDTDGLDLLLTADGVEAVEVSTTVYGHSVSLHSDGRVTVRPRE